MNPQTTNIVPSIARTGQPLPPPTTIAAPQESGDRQTFLGWLRRAAPTMLVLAVLGGVAVWGHTTGWTLPKFSALFGNGQTGKDWCDEHSVSEKDCVECNPGLWPKAKAYGWCKVHGVHDCPLENPDVAQLVSPPSDEVIASLKDRAQRALDFAARPENSKKCTIHPKRLQVTAKAVAKLRLTPEPVWEAPIEETVTAYGEIIYNPQRVVSLASPLSGKVWKVEKNIGDIVKKDEVLAFIEAPDVGKFKSDFLQAVAQLDLKAKAAERKAQLVDVKAVSPAEYELAKTEAREAHISAVRAQQALANLGMTIRLEEVKSLSPEELGRRVQFLGLPESLLRTLDPYTTTSNLYALRSSISGHVIPRKAVPVTGELADPTKTLFVVADTSEMWLSLHVPQNDRRRVEVGQKVRFRADGHSEVVAGKITWRSPEVDDVRRTMQVRVELPNPKGHLLANTFGTGTIILREEKSAVVVKNEAMHSDGNCNIVFVQDKDFHKEGAPKLFHVRTIRPGARNDQYTEVIAGILPGEVVITSGSEALRTQLLKSTLGAG